MPGRARISIARIPRHIIQRGNNRSACFYAGEDYDRYLATLREQAEQHECRIHAYVLMTNLSIRLACRDLFNGHLDADAVSDIRASTNGNFALGNGRFKQEIAAMPGRRVTPARAGRPSRKE